MLAVMVGEGPLPGEPLGTWAIATSLLALAALDWPNNPGNK